MRLPEDVSAAMDRLERAGFAAYAVGGCVRDAELGLAPHDWDVCTAATPAEMQRVFAGERTIETGLRHGTLTVILDRTPLEITTFRQDGAYLDGRHPSAVRFTRRIEDDLSRRDFTVNAMAYRPEEGVVDPFGGRRDCALRVIRCVGAPETRFAEDALRILRALRFAAKLDFTIDPATARAAVALRGTLNKISRERVAAEMNGLLLGRAAGRVLRDYPAVAAQSVRGLTAEDVSRAAQSVALLPAVLPLRWSALLFPLSPACAREALEALKMPGSLTRETERILAACRAHITPDSLPEALVRYGEETLRAAFSLRSAQGDLSAEACGARLSALLRQGVCHSLRQLAVNGDDLRAIGLTGRQIGDTLQALLLCAARGEALNERGALLAAARRMQPADMPEGGAARS